ncbi:MAG: tRNA uridine-5-carboxymethylaminomethyl(34) synthesis GTPase MnmE [Roseobacter sp.]
MDTIFAQATALGRGGVSVIRISGRDALSVAASVCGSLPKFRVAAIRSLKSSDGEILDQALVIAFKGPASFTGEDIVEFQVHGSIAVVQSVMTALSDDPRARLAEPGDFTRRALENGRLDLSQVEGLADLIDAETEAQRKQAQRVLSGALGKCVELWRRDLIRAAALLEATIDFADEEVPVDVSIEVCELLDLVMRDLGREIDGSHVAERIKSGFEVAIVGPPNAGKSTLLNKLAGRDAAITSEMAGTTRDIIEVRMNLGGLPVTFLDTAGLRESSDSVEAIGISRAIERAKSADLRVFLVSPGDDLLLKPIENDICLIPKIDLVEDSNLGVSGKTGHGVSSMLSNIQEILGLQATNAGLATHERHRVAMLRAFEGLAEAREVLGRGPDFYDIASEEMRSSIRALETLVGRIDVENLLDEIFSSFCLGK